MQKSTGARLATPSQSLGRRRSRPGVNCLSLQLVAPSSRICETHLVSLSLDLFDLAVLFLPKAGHLARQEKKKKTGKQLQAPNGHSPTYLLYRKTQLRVKKFLNTQFFRGKVPSRVVCPLVSSRCPSLAARNPAFPVASQEPWEFCFVLHQPSTAPPQAEKPCSPCVLSSEFRSLQVPSLREDRHPWAPLPRIWPDISGRVRSTVWCTLSPGVAWPLIHWQETKGED